MRLLEVRLLVYSDEHHTETGAHAKFLQTWRGFARDARRHPPMWHSPRLRVVRGDRAGLASRGIETSAAVVEPVAETVS